MDIETLLKETSHNQSQDELLNIVSLYKKLKWDSDFWGINIGYISCLKMTPNIEKNIKSFVKKENISMLQYLCNCHDKYSVMTAEGSGYSFVDIRLTYEQFLSNDIQPVGDCEYNVRKARNQDIDELKKLTQNIYNLSRYYYDANFERSKVEEFYSGWIEKAVLGKFDDFAYILCKKDQPVGFCSVKLQGGNSASIGIFGMSNACSGKGLAKYLLDSTLLYLKKNNIKYISVVTQGRNYAAQRLYQRCGFITKSVELWYHKWFR